MDIVKTASEGTCTSLSYGEGLYLEVSGSEYTDFQNMGEGEGYQYSSELKIERVNYYISYYISIWRHTHVILRDKQSTTGKIYLILMDPLIIL